MRNVIQEILIDTITLQEFYDWYYKREKDFKDFSEFLVTMAYHGMKDDIRRSKKEKR